MSDDSHSRPPAPPPGSTPAAHEAPPPQTSAKAIASLILPIILGPLGAVVAIPLGHSARGDVDADPQRITGRGVATAGIVIGWIVIALSIITGVIIAILISLVWSARPEAVALALAG